MGPHMRLERAEDDSLHVGFFDIVDLGWAKCCPSMFALNHCCHYNLLAATAENRKGTCLLLFIAPYPSLWFHPKLRYLQH